MTYLVLIALYLALGVVSAGFTLGSFQHRFPAFNHNGMELFAFLTGPIGLIATFFTFGFKNLHWRLTPSTRAERCHWLHQLYPNLSYSHFMERSEP